MSIKNIEASLSRGRFYTGKVLVLIYFCLFISILMPITTLIIVALNHLIGEFSIDMIVSITITNFLSIIIFLTMIYIIVKNHKHKLYLLIVLKTTCLLEADIIRCQDQSDSKRNQILVSFYLDNKIHYKKSNVGNKLMGYPKVFLNHLGKNQKILYSSQYDDVILLKKTLNQ